MEMTRLRAWADRYADAQRWRNLEVLEEMRLLVVDLADEDRKTLAELVRQERVSRGLSTAADLWPYV